jgi:hypothetical protein
MRRLMIAFLIASPFIALAQDGRWPALMHSPHAQAVVHKASAQVATVVHAVQALLT